MVWAGTSVLLMQSQGVVNCVSMLSLNALADQGARFPFLTLVSMQGEFSEGSAWRFPMGQTVAVLLTQKLIGAKQF